MPIYTIEIVRRNFVKAHPKALFVFGDNMQRRGYGGQAAAVRGEPNSIGIPTKWAPTNHPDAFFYDNDFWQVKPAIDEAFGLIASSLEQGKDVFVPTAGIGTGRADLPNKAPQIYSYIVDRLNRLEKKYAP